MLSVAPKIVKANAPIHNISACNFDVANWFLLMDWMSNSDCDLMCWLSLDGSWRAWRTRAILYFLFFVCVHCLCGFCTISHDKQQNAGAIQLQFWSYGFAFGWRTYRFLSSECLWWHRSGTEWCGIAGHQWPGLEHKLPRFKQQLVHHLGLHLTFVIDSTQSNNIHKVIKYCKSISFAVFVSRPFWLGSLVLLFYSELLISTPLLCLGLLESRAS